MTRTATWSVCAGLLIALALTGVPVKADMGKLERPQHDGSQQGPAPLAAVEPDQPQILETDTVPDLLISPSSGVIVSKVVSGATLADLGAGYPFGADFPCGVRMAGGDLTGDGVADLVLGMGPCGGLVKLLDGQTIADLGGGYPFGSAFGGGVSVAVGDINGDGINDIVTGQASGGGRVSVFSGQTYVPLLSVTPFGSGYSGGVNVSTGDVDGDGRSDILVGQASGGGVSVISGATGTALIAGEPFGAVNGMFVAAGDVTGDGRAEIIVAPGSGTAPVIVFNLATMQVVAALNPYPGFTGGVRVAAADLNGDGRTEIITTPGPGIAPVMRVFDGATFANTRDVPVYPGSFTAGTLVSATITGSVRFSSAAATSFAVGTAGSFTVRTVGNPPATSLSVTGTLPTGVTFVNNGNGTGTLSGTPGNGTSGAYPLTFSASNGRGAPVQQAFVLTVGQAPTITSAASAAFTTGASTTFTITTTGFPRPSITLSGSLPAGLSFTDRGDGSATVSGQAATGTNGTYPVTVTASNGIGSAATQALSVTVSGAPVFTSPSTAIFTVGVAGTFTLTTNATPPVTSIARFGQLPLGLGFTDNGNGTGTISGTPPLGSAGTYTVEFQASNGTASGFQTLTIQVREAPAITSANSTTFSLNVPGTFTVTATGTPTPTVSFTGTLPTGVTFTALPNGTATIAGTPAPGTAGSYVLTLRASNGAASDAVQTFTLVVTGAPAITSAAATTFVTGTPGTFTVTASGGPAPTIGISGALPAGVTFTNNGNGTGTLSGTPAGGTGGTYPLTFTATNGIGSPASQNFVLTVNQPPAVTSVNNTAFTVNVPSSFTFTTSGFPAATVAVTGTLPAGVAVTPNGNGTATLAGTPTALGTFNLSVQASNGVGAPATQPFTLTITSCTIVTVLPGSGALPGARYNTAYSQTFSATGGTGHTFAVTAGALPPGLTLASGGGVTGAPSNTGNFNFTVTATASNGCSGSAAYSLAVTPNAQPETYNNGVGNTQYVVGASAPSTPAVVVGGNVLSNDAGIGTLTASPASIATTNGGQVTLASNGTFVYTPAVGFAGPSDSFTYTVTDSNSATATATATLNMNGVVWFVNPSAPAGDGRSQSPFNTMTAAASAAQINHVIYVHPGSPTGATVLKAGQRLQGAGEAYTLNGLTIAAGAAPVLSGSIALADGVAVRALTVNAGGGASVTGSNLAGAEVLTNVTISGGATGLSLTNVGGSLTLSGGAISGVGAGGGVAISGGNGTIAIAAPITTTSGHSVSVQNHNGGTVTFSGAISDSGTGVLLNANTGATVAFTGGLTVATSGVPAFTATGGGTVTATQNNTSIVNSLNAAGATALNVTNTQIGAAGLTFRSITSSGGTDTGVILDNTGTGGGNGGLTVTGNGTAGSGGTISGKSGTDGVFAQGSGFYLNATRNVALNRMMLFSFANSGIVGRDVAGFLMADSLIDNAGSTAGAFEGPVVFGRPAPGAFNGLAGTATFHNTPISSGVDHNVALYAQSGTFGLVIDRTTANPSDCKVESNSPVTGEDGVTVRAEGTSTGTITISQCLMRGNREAAIDVLALEQSHVTVNVLSSDIGRSSQGDRGIILTNGGDAALTGVLDSNNLFALPGLAIRVGQVSGNASAASDLRVSFINNTFDSAVPVNTNTILASLTGSPGAVTHTRLLFQDNFGEHTGLQPAILVETPDAGTAPAVDVTVVRNHMDMFETSPGVNAPFGLTVRANHSANICGNIAPNTTHWIPIGLGTGGGIRAEQLGASTFRLERGTQTLGTPAATVLSVNNGPYFDPRLAEILPGSSTSLTGTLLVVENGTCLVP